MGMVSSLRRSLVLAGVIAAVLVAASVSGAAKVDPVLLTGASNQGKDCSDNQGDQTWTQLKVDPNADGTYTDGTLTVTISNTQDDKTFDWSSNIGVDAVIVKGGDDGSYLYRYDPPSEETSDTGLTTPGQNAISHVNFCYDVEAPPAQGSLTVIKHVDNSKGGSASAGDFQMNVAGPTPLSFAGAESPGTTNSVDPGAYTVTESGGPSDYALTYSGDCDSSGHVTVAADQTATCTLTNTGQAPAPGKIIVEKDTIPFEAEPPAGAFIFTGDITANLLPGQSASEDVAPGTYTVSEDISKRPFWDLGSIKCDDSDSTGDVSTFTATYHVSPGENGQVRLHEHQAGRDHGGQEDRAGRRRHVLPLRDELRLGRLLAPRRPAERLGAAQGGGDLLGLGERAERLGPDERNLRQRRLPGRHPHDPVRDAHVHVREHEGGAHHRQEGDGRRHRQLRLQRDADRNHLRERWDARGDGRPGPVHLHGGGQERLGSSSISCDDEGSSGTGVAPRPSTCRPARPSPAPSRTRSRPRSSSRR